MCILLRSCSFFIASLFFSFYLQHVNAKKYVERKNELRKNVQIIIDDNCFNY